MKSVVTYQIESIKHWKQISDMGYSPCDKTLVFNAASYLDLPRSQKDTEYLLDWKDVVGSLPFIMLRIAFGNLTYYNVDTEGNFVRGFGTLVPITKKGRQFITVIVNRRDESIISEIHFNHYTNDQVRFVMRSTFSEDGVLSLAGYVSAFKWQVWLSLALTVLLGGMFLNIFQYAFSLHQSGNAELLHVYNILLAQGTSSLKKNRWFYGAWTLGGLVLTNAYLGDILKLTAPIPLKN